MHEDVLPKHRLDLLNHSRLADYTDELAANLSPSRRVVYKQVGGRDLHLNLFEPPDLQPGDRRPCFLSIHGGGWTSLGPHRQYPTAAHFAARGMIGMSLEYRLVTPASGTTVFDCVRDARSAMRYLRTHAEELCIDPRKIVTQGGSAGGHLAVGTALFDGIDEAGEDASVSCAPQALVLFFPVIDTSAGGFGHARLGNDWRTLSPLHRVRPGGPPTLLFHGTGDTVTPFPGARAFRDAMIRAGNECELVVN
ncbi:MAG: alpha/beta hydrolase, partial [Kiritimatiellia bacterium]|nr:alpha/beta hydrolase [Kiritimatiellia bacterium]